MVQPSILEIATLVVVALVASWFLAILVLDGPRLDNRLKMASAAYVVACVLVLAVIACRPDRPGRTAGQRPVVYRSGLNCPCNKR